MPVEPEGLAQKAFVAIAIDSKMVNFFWCHKPHLIAECVGWFDGEYQFYRALTQHIVLRKYHLD